MKTIHLGKLAVATVLIAAIAPSRLPTDLADWQSSHLLACRLHTRKRMRQEILIAHNKYRTEINLPPLAWSETLAQDAQAWASHNAALGGRTIQHSYRKDQGESSWWGTSKAFTYTQMIDVWGAEKQHFKPGMFPDLSTTGNWIDVGHYTQMVWKTTQYVGCGLATAGGNDILICRYSPPGNYVGKPPY
jgi:hypothetical protein